MSLASIVSSFYPITFGSIREMAHLKLASEGGPQHLIFMFLAIFKHGGDHGSNICSLIANFKLDSCSAKKNNLLFN